MGENTCGFPYFLYVSIIFLIYKKFTSSLCSFRVVIILLYTFVRIDSHKESERYIFNHYIDRQMKAMDMKSRIELELRGKEASTVTIPS